MFEDASGPNDGRFDNSDFILFGDVIADDDFDFDDFLEDLLLLPPPPPPPIAEDVDELFDGDIKFDAGAVPPPPPLPILLPPADGPLLLLSLFLL